MSKAIDDFKVGEDLFRYVECGGIHRYRVVGIRSYEDSTQLEVEDQSCNHGWKCRVLVARNDYGKIHAVHMLNDDEDDSQRIWHRNEGFHFWPTVEEARLEATRFHMQRADERVRKAEESLASAKQRKKELQDLIDIATGGAA